VPCNDGILRVLRRKPTKAGSPAFALKVFVDAKQILRGVFASGIHGCIDASRSVAPLRVARFASEANARSEFT